MTTTTELTPWFPPASKPERPGVYLVQHGWHVYSRWDGQRWGKTYFDIYTAATTPFVCENQSLPWRGLREDPERKSRELINEMRNEMNAGEITNA